MNEVFQVDRAGDAATRTNYERLLALVRDEGMDYKWAKAFVDKLDINERAFAPPADIRRWALERGFMPGRVEMLGLDQSNYHLYLPDYSYFMIHPLNHHFKKWLDKLTLKYVLNSGGCASAMPDYYIYMENNGNYTYLMDFPQNVKKDKHVILNLLREKGALMIKPNSSSSGGRGVMKVVWQDGDIYINNSAVTLREFEDMTRSIPNNIITAYCRQHAGLDVIWPGSECTLRVVMAKLPYREPWQEPVWRCVMAFARFGAAITGGASNISVGGIGVGFDYNTGELYDFGTRSRRFCPDGNYVCYEHPDTHIAWKGFRLSNWDGTKDMIERVCRQISSLDYLGMDIIITNDGMKLCEINSHPAMDTTQFLCPPILADADNRAFFEYHGLYKVDNRRFYELYTQAQDMG